MLNEEYSTFLRGKLIAICEAILKEEIGIIAGSRRLNGLGNELCGDNDEDFLIFIAIESETDHLPVDWERRNWSDEALQRKDREIAETEAVHQDRVFAACKRLIGRFGFRV
jgi:hypothetical protein